MEVNSKSKEIAGRLLNAIGKSLLNFIPLFPNGELHSIIKDLTKSKKSIDEKIEKALSSLNETSELINELETDLSNRVNKLNELKTTYERYSKLAEIEEEKIKPLMEQLEMTMGKGRNLERFVSFGINILAGLLLFVLGIWASPHVKNWFIDSEISTEQTTPLIERDSSELDSLNLQNLQNHKKK